MTNIVELRRDGATAVITVDNPPVNALKHEVRRGLMDAFTQARKKIADPDYQPARELLTKLEAK